MASSSSWTSCSVAVVGPGGRLGPPARPGRPAARWAGRRSRLPAPSPSRHRPPAGRPTAVTRRGEQRGAGRGAQLVAARRRSGRGRPTSASSASTAGAGTGSRPCAARTMPCPSATGEPTVPARPGVQRGGHPDDVGDRVQRADLVEVHLLGRRPVRCGLRRGQPGEHVEGGPRTGSARSAASSSPRMFAQVRTTGAALVRTWTQVAARPPRTAGSGSSRDRLGADRVDGGLERLSRRPRPAAPRAACPRWPPASHWNQAVGHRRAPVRADRRATRAAKTPAPNPLSMLMTTTPGAQRVEHAEQRRQAVERGAVPDAGRHRDQRQRRPVRRRRTAARPPSRRRRRGSPRRRARSRTARSRCSPATPTSSTRATPAPKTAAVSAASAATGPSEVPAATHAHGARRGPAAARRRPCGPTASTARPGARPPRAADAVLGVSRVASTARSGCAACSVREQVDGLLGCLARAVDDLGVAGPLGAVGVHPREAEVGETRVGRGHEPHPSAPRHSPPPPSILSEPSVRSACRRRAAQDQRARGGGAGAVTLTGCR